MSYLVKRYFLGEILPVTSTEILSLVKFVLLFISAKLKKKKIKSGLRLRLVYLKQNKTCFRHQGNEKTTKIFYSQFFNGVIAFKCHGVILI